MDRSRLGGHRGRCHPILRETRVWGRHAVDLPRSTAQAVAFVIDDHRSVSEVARNIGVHEMTLGRWVKKARESAGSSSKSLDVSERAELERLRAENAELKMQVEFAKK
ncbi:transposase [Actinopolymorpha sp. B17G11]|uniref:transposase n=1 Tax=Actinopolymorpha sp. B17G11 TaxID=3160861 RepID=UPI0032E43FBE